MALLNQNLLICVWAILLCLAGSPAVPDQAGQPLRVAKDRFPIQSAAVLAAAGSSNAEKQTTPDAPQDEGSEQKEDHPAQDGTTAPPGSQAKPLKPFVPSEEVQADQAVDFPYDI